MSMQLYEVDVFMFFLKDLEAVTTNFYHDLWQSTRMHTPKVCSALCSLLVPYSQQPSVPMQCLHIHWTSAISATASWECTRLQPQDLTCSIVNEPSSPCNITDRSSIVWLMSLTLSAHVLRSLC